ncbi:flagellar motor protein MotB [Bacillus fonticola]|uniref:flagellar motor protein MotB n=1 Tax=Bacillus fonticola TaxID=2728853 RepID=UPI001472AC0A|nr:flagellar motor protein MotB [Bacillus fonticola]
MARRKRKKNEEDHIDETWLIPYADLLTLLLALFIVLFAASNVDIQKFRQIAESLNSAFTGGTGVLEYDSTLPENIPVVTEEEEEEEEEEEKEEKSKEETDHERNELIQVKEKIDTYIKNNELDLQLITALTDEGLLLTILNDALFESGSDVVQSSDVALAREISELLVMNPPRNIIVSGHTDNVPIRNSQFDSNWHLSVMRAVNFMKILLENDDLDPRSFSAKGFGEFEPIASNATAEGRMKNRRVEILILPNE